MAIRKHQGTKSTRSLNPRGQSCLPCRIHKIQCNRALPCKACIRHGREEACRKNPPATVLGISEPARHSQLHIAARLPTAELLPGNSFTASPASAHYYSRPPSSGVVDEGPSVSNTTSKQYRWDVQPPNNGPNISLRSRPELQSLSLLQKFQSVEKFCPPNSVGPQASSMMPSPAPSLLSPASWSGVDVDKMGVGLVPSFPIGGKANVEATKIRLVSLLPTHAQCDVLVAYYYDHCDYLYRAIHVPTFRAQYTRLWTQHVLDIDLAWLSLLLSILSVAASVVPTEVCEGFQLQSSELRKLCQVWHLASGQALQAIDFESHPTLTQLQTFIVSQLYCFVTNDVESFNS